MTFQLVLDRAPRTLQTHIPHSAIESSEEPLTSAPSALEINAEDLETRSQSQKLRSNIQRKIGNSVAPSGYFIRVLVYFIYLAIGAYVFLCLERQNEIELCQAAKNISTLYMKGRKKLRTWDYEC